MQEVNKDTNHCALNSISDFQVTKVIHAFWRRIYPYRNGYGRELPDPMPVEFMAHMATALTWVDKKEQLSDLEIVQKALDRSKLTDDRPASVEFLGDGTWIVWNYEPEMANVVAQGEGHEALLAWAKQTIGISQNEG